MTVTEWQGLYISVFANFHCSFYGFASRSQVMRCSQEDMSANVTMPLEVTLRGLYFRADL